MLNAPGINRHYGVGRHPQTSLWVAPRRYVTELTNQSTKPGGRGPHALNLAPTGEDLRSDLNLHDWVPGSKRKIAKASAGRLGLLGFERGGMVPATPGPDGAGPSRGVVGGTHCIVSSRGHDLGTPCAPATIGYPLTLYEEEYFHSFSAAAFLSLVLLGCGGSDAVKGGVDGSGQPDPVYSILPDDAPLRDQVDEAAANIERELLEEQEKFYQKRREETRRFNSGPDGDLLVSEESFSRLTALMDSPDPVRLKITPQRFRLLVPHVPGGSYEEPMRGTVHMLSGAVPAEAEYSNQVSVNSIGLMAVYEYLPPTGAALMTSRTIRYAKTPSGTWQRIKIEETPVGAPQ